MISQDFANPVLLLCGTHLVRILVWLEDFDAYPLGLLTPNFSICQINFRMHSVTNLLDCLDGAFRLLVHLNFHSEVALDALALGGSSDGLDLLSALTNGTLWVAQAFKMRQL